MPRLHDGEDRVLRVGFGAPDLRSQQEARFCFCNFQEQSAQLFTFLRLNEDLKGRSCHVNWTSFSLHYCEVSLVTMKGVNMFRVSDKERRKGRKPGGKEGSEEAEPILAGWGHTGPGRLGSSRPGGRGAGSRPDPAGGGMGAVCELVFR